MSRRFIFLGLAIEIVSILITLYSANAVRQAAQEKHQATFERRVDRGMEAALNRVRSYEHLLIAATGFFNGSNDVSRAEWIAFTDSLNIDQNFPGINGIGFIRKVQGNETEAFLEKVHKSGAPEFKIKTIGPIPPGPRYIVDYIQPLERNRESRGLDIGSNPQRRNSANYAMFSGTTSITDIIHLVQDHEKSPGFLMLRPVYSGGITPPTKEGRLNEIMGWTYAPFIGKKIMAGISEIAGPGISLDIYDESISDRNRIFQGILNKTDGKHSIRTIEICDQTWVFNWRTDDEGLVDSLMDNESWWVLTSGLMTSTALLLLMILFYRKSSKTLDLLNKSMREKELFLSTMSHEIRTPLHGVIGLSEILKDSTELDEESREHVNDLQSSAQTLYTLINNILDYAKIREGKVFMESVLFQPASVLYEIETIFKVTSREKDIILNADADPDLWVRGDPLRIKQIIMNLVGNAIKFTQKGKVTTRAFYDRNYLILIVEDSGKGIDGDYLKQLYKPFTQEDASTSREYGGTGLGMAIVKELIELMNGNISVQSEAGQGSSFRISIPLERSVAPMEVHEEELSERDLSIRVLLVEDNAINIKLGKKVLSRMGCEVVVAENGQLALDLLEKDQDFSLILMDLSMPVMDGFEAARIIRERGIKIKMMAFSANVEPSDQDRALESGMDGFIHKPIQRQELNDAIHQARGWS